MHDQDRHVDQFGQCDGAVRGLALDQHRPRVGMKARRGAAGGFQPLGQPLDAVGVLGMDHRHRAVLARDRQHVEDLAVVELQVVVGHVDLERGVALGDQCRQFLFQHRRRRVADDQVEGVVHMRLALGAAVVVVDRGAQRLALHLRGERDHGRGAAAGRRARAGVEIVGHARRRRHRLVEVAMRVDAAGRDDAAGRIDLARGRRQALRQRDDAPAGDADVAVEDIGCSGHARMAHDEIERGHGVGCPCGASNTRRASSSSVGPSTSTQWVPRPSTSRQCSASSSATGPPSAVIVSIDKA